MWATSFDFCDTYCIINIAANKASDETGIQLFPDLTNTTFLSIIYISGFLKQYAAFPIFGLELALRSVHYQLQQDVVNYDA